MDSAELLAQKLAELSTKRKEAKEKTKGQQAIANRPIGYRTIGRVAQSSSPPITEVVVEPQQMATVPQQQAIDDSPQAKAERRSQSIKALEIDDYVMNLVMEGLVAEDYFQRAAHVCTVLGLQRVNYFVLQARQAVCDPKKGQSKQKLLAWKMNGAMQLHYKRIHFEQTRVQQHES
jgi:hypothetical protein